MRRFLLWRRRWEAFEVIEKHGFRNSRGVSGLGISEKIAAAVVKVAGKSRLSVNGARAVGSA
jgi:hypothetical protein